MIIETIAGRESDTEVCVTCPACGASEYFDPRPWRCCIGCARIRVSGFITQCSCGVPSEPTGEGVEYVPGCFDPAESQFLQQHADKDEMAVEFVGVFK